MTGDVVIIGGGIAGLAAAYELQRLGVPFLVVERAPRPGGVIFTDQIDGFTIEAGPDALLAQKPDAITLCEELGIADRLIPTSPPRRAFIQRGGRLHPLPEASILGIPTRAAPFLRTRLFSWPAKLRMGMEIVVPRRTAEEDESIGAFMRRRFGSEAVAYLAEPLLAGIHAGDVDRLSVKALFDRFARAEQTSGSVIRAFRAAQKRRPQGAGDQGAFRSFRGGLMELICALVKTLPSDALRFGVTARGIMADDGFTVETDAGPLAARAVIAATPAYVTASLMRSLDADLASECDGVRYASSATISFGFLRSAIRHPLDGSGYLVPRAEDRSILAVSWMSSKWAGRAPAGHVLLRVFVGGARDPEALSHSDEQLIARALTAIRPVLGIGGDPEIARIYRFAQASAQHEVGHLDRVRRIEDRLARHPGLFVTGSGFRATGIPDGIADARATAARTASFLHAHPQ